MKENPPTQRRTSVQDYQSPVGAGIEARRAYWHSRRGMAELEQQLLPFMLQCYDSLSDAQQQTYHRLLEHEDWEIFDWLQGTQTPQDEELRALIAQIQAR